MAQFFASVDWLKVCALAALVYSIALHELGHAVVAYWCGDDTAKRLGRITLNPLPSIDFFGSIVIPILAYFGGFMFGWAKPVPVVPDRFRHRVFGDIVVSLAGIVVNLTLAFILFVVRTSLDDPKSSLGYFCLLVGSWNILLAVFNMLPIPPLDGSEIFKYGLPPAWRRGYQKIGYFGIMVVLLLVYFVPEVQAILFEAISLVRDSWMRGAKVVVDLFG